MAIRQWLERSLAARLGVLLTLSAALSATIVMLAMLAISWWATEEHVIADIDSDASTTAFALQAPVAFLDEVGIRDAMVLLQTHPQIRGAWVYDGAGALLYSWGSVAPVAIGAHRGSLREGWLERSRPIAAGATKDAVGTLTIHTDLGEVLSSLRRQVAAAVVASLATLLLVLSIARGLARRITVPVVQLAEAASAIARDQRYERRLPPAGADEVGVAVAAFNHMIDEVQRRGDALGELNLELQTKARESQAARQEAEAASLAKSRFLANMSHELRSPLNGVIGAAQLLQAEGSDARRRGELVDIIRTSGTNLLGLIESVLDLARIEAGAMQVSAEDFDLAECVQAALQSSSAVAAAKGLRLDCVVDPAIGPWRHGDGLRLRQLLLNLLGNAVKFTPSGAVRLEVLPGHSAGELLFHVRDTGVGIDPEGLAAIFEPFQQGDASTTRRFGGSGLGLTICRDLSRLMGGGIEVRSQPGVGSCFTLRLPLPEVVAPGALAARAAGAHDAAGSSAARSAGARQMIQVLVVEDDPINQSVVASLLRHAGCRCQVASDGAGALRMLADLPMSLVLMDWQMPDMDGLEVTRRLRAGEAGLLNQAVPVVALTANAFAEDRQACLEAGMNDFLTKPVLAGRLIEAVDLWAVPEAPPPDLRREAVPGGPGHRLLPIHDPSVLAALPMVADGSDPGYADELLALFSKDTRRQLDAIDDAWRCDDRVTLQRRVHTLKATAGQVGAMALAATAGALEDELRGSQTPEWPALQCLRGQFGQWLSMARPAEASDPVIPIARQESIP